tara:strand:- start:1572 stop:2651 length:1080 start_codon:yes stop_codon:yes gene_type:complete
MATEFIKITDNQGRQWMIPQAQNRPVYYRCIDDKLIAVNHCDYVGVPYDEIKAGKIETLPEEYDGWFPFMPLCWSMGDWAVRSGIFKALKVKYPKIKIAVPKMPTIQKICSTDPFFNQEISMSYTLGNGDIINPGENMRNVLQYNPNIDHYFDAGVFATIFTDHDRAYTEIKNINGKSYSAEEPLAEQILKRFGFTDKDIETIDSTPQLYFHSDEIQEYDKIIDKYIGRDKQYGCLLFSSRVEKFNGRWEFDNLLYEDAERFKDLPVFYYSSFDLDNTEWANFFPNRFDFNKLNLTIRQQLYIKCRAVFNLGYQAGITDACGGSNSEIITLSPYDSIGENRIRGVKYIFKNGRILQDVH